MSAATARRASRSVRTFEGRARKARQETYELCLFIAGTTALSSAALATVISVCEERLVGRYVLVVVDVYQQPARAKADQIIAVPTLVRRRPSPLRRIIGDLSDRAQLLHGLDLPFHPTPGHEANT
jgi:circadian clock protein KaiB